MVTDKGTVLQPCHGTAFRAKRNGAVTAQEGLRDLPCISLSERSLNSPTVWIHRHDILEAGHRGGEQVRGGQGSGRGACGQTEH